MRVVLVLLTVSLSGCFLSPSYRADRREARAKRIAIRDAEEDARLARANYCTQYPEACSQDITNARYEQEQRRERKAAKWRAVGAAFQAQQQNLAQQPAQPQQPAPTYVCTDNGWGRQTCKPRGY